MEDKLLKILSSFNYPFFLQGTLAKDEPYPADFFTFWNSDSDSESYYDNNEHKSLYSFKRVETKIKR